MNKLSKLVGLMFLLVVAVGCDSVDANICYESVVDEFQNSKVYLIPGESFRFIVADSSGNIWYVETYNATNTDVSQKTKLFNIDDVKERNN